MLSKGGTKELNYPRSKSAIVVLEGFGVLIVTHAIGGYYCGPWLAETFIELPQVTVAMLSSSSISPVIALIYLGLRTKFIPRFNVKKETFISLLPIIVMAWIVVFVSVLLYGKESLFGQEILKTLPPYYYLNLFLVVLFGPLLEETLSRGYFFEILKQSWGNTKALLLSSVLFVIPHSIWGSLDISLFFIFLFSIVFTLAYIMGGLVTAILVHAFVNFYLFYLNTG